MTDITEMTSFDVERLDAVGAPANGTEWLMLKAAGDARGTVGSAEKRDTDPDVGGGVDRDKIPADDFAGKHRSFPIVSPKDVHDAAASIGRAGDDNYSSEQLKANIIRIATRKGPKFVAKLPKSWRKQDAEKAAPDGLVSSPPPASAGAALPTDGTGSSLGAQSTDPAPLLTQTDENCAPPAAPDGQQQAHQDAQTQKADGEPEGGKKKLTMSNPADNDPGSTPWEHKDVALGEQTIATLEHALELARTFTAREKAEGETPATKETDMTADEIVKLLDERDEARRARKAAKKAAKENDTAREDAKAAKAAKKAAKAAKASVEDLESRLAAVENQPARSRPILNGAAGTAGDRSESSAFKQLEERIAAAVDAKSVARELDARQQLSTAKMIAMENARERGDLRSGSQFGPNMTPMLTNAYQIGDDSSIDGVR